MKIIDCPVCGYGFMRRKRRRCPRCEVLLLREGEWYVNEESDIAFLTDGKEWRELWEHRL